MPKYEMHLHTSECDKCAITSAADAVRLYKEAGYDGMFITDHYFAKFFEWFDIEQNEENHRIFADRWLRGYRTAREEGEKIGFSVFLGAELRFDGENINDYLLYGLTEEDIYELPYLNRLGSITKLREVLPDRVLIVQAHPFRDGMTVADPTALFGIETHNGRNKPIRNELAIAYARHYGKREFSGSDFHAEKHIATGGIITPDPVYDSAQMISVLKSGNYELIRNYKNR